MADRCKWVATVNWNGGVGKNIEINLFAENRNCEMKKLIKAIGANKMDKAIGRASKASGGITKVVEAFESQVRIIRRSSTHTHKLATANEILILHDLRTLQPFKKDGQNFESFVGISDNPTHSRDKINFNEWIKKHKKNILLHYPVAGENEQSD